jgi:hypothetical protein
MTVEWPALISFSGDPELEFIADESAYQDCLHDFAGHFVEGDRLIDSLGQSFLLTPQGDYQTLGGSLSLDALITLIQEHAFAENNVCVAKIAPPDIASAIKLLKPLV